MKKAAGFSFLFGLVWVLLACKLIPEDKIVANCNARETEGFCFEYSERDVESGKKVCKDFAGTWSKGTCDRTKAFGMCKMNTGIHKVFYESSKFASAEDAKSKCYDKWVGPNEN